MKKIINFSLVKIIISSILFLIAFFVGDMSIYFLLLSYIIISFEIYLDAIKSIMNKELFDENLLMILATLCAFFIGSYTEAVMVMLLFEIGEFLADLAITKSKDNIMSLMDLRCDTVNLKIGSDIKVVSSESVKINDLFIVKVGERVPIDGVIVDGESYVDTASLTGEAVPRKVSIGDSVLSGYINNLKVLTVKATTIYEESTASKILKMLLEADDRKAESVKFITKFSRIYTPVIVFCAILLVLIPTLLGYNFNDWLYRGLVFLVTSCPCALVISVPLAYFCGIGRLSHEGILVKSSNVIDDIKNVKNMAFDKTGTITEGSFEVVKIKGKSINDEKLLEVAAYAESLSLHPIGKSIITKYNKKIDDKRITNYKEISGRGISCKYLDQDILIGNQEFFNDKKIEVEEVNNIGSVIYISIDHKYSGYIVVSDKIKDKSREVIKSINNSYNTIMLSGDKKEVVSKVCSEVGIKSYYSNLLPTDKVIKVKELKKNGGVLYIGDGINDALAIKYATIGVAMGGIGSDASIDASDIVIMRDDLEKIEEFLKIAKLTRNKVKFNISFALAIKFLILVLAVFGISTIWMAVFADVGVTFIAIINSLIIMYKKRID